MEQQQFDVRPEVELKFEVRLAYDVEDGRLSFYCVACDWSEDSWDVLFSVRDKFTRKMLKDLPQMNEYYLIGFLNHFDRYSRLVAKTMPPGMTHAEYLTEEKHDELWKQSASPHSQACGVKH
jgi:hypothetical protein